MKMVPFSSVPFKNENIGAYIFKTVDMTGYTLVGNAQFITNPFSAELWLVWFLIIITMSIF